MVLPLTRFKQYAKFIPRSNLPIVLLALAGNRLEVSTAIFTNAVYADKLPSIELVLGTHAQDNILRVARIFTAISKCTAGLRGLYNDLETSPDRVPSVEFPNPTADPSASPPQQIPTLEFLCKLDRVHSTGLITVDADNERHAIYLAKGPPDLSGDATVLVKFTPKYNEAAHRMLAGQTPPLAPKLFSCRRVIGGLWMVVMEYLSDAKPLYHFFPQSSLRPPSPDVRIVQRDLSKALELLHNEDFVFGDLRGANVLYSPKDGGRAFLVDFDGVGKHGEDRYSSCLNLKLGLGVARWEIMDKSHDTSNLERIIAWLRPRVPNADGE